MMNGTEEIPSELKSNVLKFRASINYPDKWKIQSIAAYKSSKKRKLEDDNSSAPNNLSEQPNTKALPERSRSYLEGKGVLTVEQRVEIIANIRRSKSKDQIENELLIWEEKCIHVRKQIQNLNLKKNLLLWLLNKSCAIERASIC
mmetsp:Transcript_8396/g.12509  ORF Transcript_8396/g.12509 Transcript_8396/m.12509 type:complete len:145 (+) Transcript_8396:84-518(+)